MKPIDSKHPKDTRPYGTAIVVDERDGIALSVQLDGEDEARDVAARLDTVCRVCVGDGVLVQLDRDAVVVVGRLARDGDSTPAWVRESDGVIHLYGERGVTLRAGESLIELGADGRIRINGRDVDAKARDSLSLSADKLKMN